MVEKKYSSNNFVINAAYLFADIASKEHVVCNMIYTANLGSTGDALNYTKNVNMS